METPFLVPLKRSFSTGKIQLSFPFKKWISQKPLSWVRFVPNRLTRGRLHATDYSNICVSGLWDPYTFQWVDWLINMLEIPKSMLPEIKDSCGDHWGSIHQSIFGAEIPIRCVVSFTFRFNQFINQICDAYLTELYLGVGSRCFLVRLALLQTWRCPLDNGYWIVRLVQHGRKTTRVHLWSLPGSRLEDW